MKHLFIINPKAGKGKTLDIIPKIEEVFRKRDDEFIIEVTKEPGHATRLVKKYVSKEIYRVYSVGGDGTLNEILNGMVNSESSLGVIPSGSGNDFIKSIYKEKISGDILLNTIKGETKSIDLVKMDDRYFINISSIGIDAEVVYNAKALKKTPFISGKMAYILSVFVTILKYKCKDIYISIDDMEIYSRSTLLAVANGKYYGGGMKVVPDADPQDGLLDVCIVQNLGKLKMLRFFPKLIKGQHKGIEEVSFYKGKKVTIDSKEEILVNIDGEILRKSKINFQIISKGIKFIIPI